MPVSVDQFFQPFAEALGLQHGLRDSLYLFGLGLARWAPVISICPFLGGRLVPTPIKMGLSALFALWLTPWLSSLAMKPLALGGMGLWILMLKEAFVGFVIGFSSSLLFWGVEMGGRFLDNARGTTSANVMIPHIRVQSSLLGDFYFQFFIVLYVLLGGHRWFISAVFQSYEIIPPLDFSLHMGALGDSTIAATAALFGILLKVIAPALVVLMMLDIMLGVANRMAPQLDVFFISLSLKATLGALIVGLSLVYLTDITPEIIRNHHHWVTRILEQFHPGS